jgi:hypothetical protein
LGFRSRIVNLALVRFQNINPVILFGYRFAILAPMSTPTLSLGYLATSLPHSLAYLPFFCTIQPSLSLSCILLLYLLVFIHRAPRLLMFLDTSTHLINHCREIRRVDICPANIIQYADAVQTTHGYVLNCPTLKLWTFGGHK